MNTTLPAVAAIAAAVLGTSGAAFAAPMRILDARGAQHVPGELLVKFKPSATGVDRRAAVATRAHSLVADLQPGLARVALRPGETVDEALSAYAADPAVEHAQPNYVYRATLTPQYSLEYSQLWAFKNTGQSVDSFVQPGGGLYFPNSGTAGNDINAEKAWDHITDCSGVVVAVVDSGVSYAHQELAGNMWDGGPGHPNHGYDFVDGDVDPTDLNGHGTHVAAIIGAAGNDGTGTNGVCWKARIMAVRVLDAAGMGTTASIIQGVNFAVEQGAKVINMSLGGAGDFDQLFSDGITAAADAGVAVVVAAGNDGSDNEETPFYPCDFTHPNLICVAALDQSYQLAKFSNYGARSVDVGAPGTNILSAWAGMNAVVAGPSMTPSSGWTLTSTTGTGWGYGVDAGYGFMVNPKGYPSGLYASGTDDRAYHSLSVGFPDAAVLSFGAAIDVRDGDYFRVACRGTNGDPFSGGTLLGELSDIATFPYVVGVGGEIPPSCFGVAGTIGFQLNSAPWSARARGLAVTGLSVTTLSLRTTSYNTESGTSMAAPMVAGLATMLRAYNPQYTAEDVVSAITQGGRAAASLAGKTTSGKAADAMGSLAHISPPTGLAAEIH